MTQRRRDDKGHSGRSWNIGNNTLIAALIGLVGAITAAFIGLSGKNAPTGASAHQQASRAAPSGSPPTFDPPPTTSPPPSTPTSGSPTSTPSESTGSKISLLKPRNQPGWALAWHNTINIGSPGIIFRPSQVVLADGQDFDLQHVPGVGWNIGPNISAISTWPNNSTPGPATIYGNFEISPPLGQDPQYVQAHVGDRLYLEVNGIGIVSYLQVTSVDTDGVLADIWLWDKA
jgi:hypothetical protein